MAKDKVKVVEIDTKPAETSVKDLRKQLKEFKDEMANLEEGSDAFLEVANKAGEVKHQLDEINESIKGASSDFGDVIGNVTNVAAGITGAFQAVAGGLQAMGIESEALEETIARMQGLMAITQGLASIDTAIKSLDKLQKSITATTGAAKLLKAALQPKVFLAIGAAISALSLTFGKLFGNAKKAAEMEKERAEAFKKLKLEEEKKKQEEYNTALEKELTLKEKIITAKYGDDDVKKIRALIKLYQTELTDLESQLKNKYRDNERLAIKSRIRELNNEIKQLDEGSQAYIETLIKITTEEDKLKKVKPYTEEEVTNLETRIKDFKQKIKDAEFDLKEAQVLQKAEAEAKTREERLKELGLVEFTDEDLEKGRKRIKEYWNEVYDIQLEQLKRSKDTDKQKLEKELAIEKERLENIKTYAGEGTLEYEKQVTNIYELQKELNEKIKEENLKNLNEIEKLGNSIFNTIKESVSAFGESSLGLTSGWIASLDQFQNIFNNVMDTVKTKGKMTWQDYGAVCSQALAGVGTMLNALSNEQDASTEEGFKQTKKLQIAASVMNMLSGIVSAWTSAMNPANAWMTLPCQIALGTATSAMIAGIGGAQIAKIQSATMESANPNTNINAKTVNSMIVPPIQYSNAVQGASTEGTIKNQRVFVTESDIVDTINKVSVAESENTY